MLAHSDGSRSLPAFPSSPVDTGRISVSSLGECIPTRPDSNASRRRSSGLHSAFSETIQEKGGLTGGVRAIDAAKKRQVRAKGLSHDDRRNVLFGQGSPGATASSSKSMSSLKMGAGLSLGGRPFCAPKGDMGAMFLRVEAVMRNAEKNKFELASNRTFIDEVHKITESGRAARAARLLEQGIVEEPVKPPTPPAKPKSMTKRIEACHDNLNSNEKEMQTTRTTLDDLLVFAGVKQVEVFDPVNFGKSTGLSAFSLGCGGETSTHVRLDAMTKNLKVNEVKLREHRELLDDVQAARNKTDTKKVRSPLGRSMSGDTFTPSASPGSGAFCLRPQAGSLASRLDAVAEAARSNALELRAFRGTIEDEKEATKRDGPSEVVGKTAPIERVFVSGQLRPDRTAVGPDRSKELSFRVQALHTNASRNFDMLSEHRQELRQHIGAEKTQKEADTTSGSTRGFGVKV